MLAASLSLIDEAYAVWFLYTVWSCPDVISQCHPEHRLFFEDLQTRGEVVVLGSSLHDTVAICCYDKAEERCLMTPETSRNIEVGFRRNYLQILKRSLNICRNGQPRFSATMLLRGEGEVIFHWSVGQLFADYQVNIAQGRGKVNQFRVEFWGTFSDVQNHPRQGLKLDLARPGVTPERGQLEMRWSPKKGFFRPVNSSYLNEAVREWCIFNVQW